MRLIAERLLPPAHAHKKTYVDLEIVSQRVMPLPPPTTSHLYHIYCSAINPGADQLLTELSEKRGMTLNMSRHERSGLGRIRSATDLVAPLEDRGDSRRSSFNRRAELNTKKGMLRWFNTLLATDNIDKLAECSHFLLYLTALTWTRGAESEVLADEVVKAMDLGVHILLAHESAAARLRRMFSALMSSQPF